MAHGSKGEGMAIEQQADARFEQVWQAALDDLQGQVSRANFETWLRATTLVDLDRDNAVIAAPNTFTVQQLRSKFDRQISDAIATLINRHVEIDYVVRTAVGEHYHRTPKSKPKPVPPAARQRQQTPAAPTPSPQTQQMELVAPSRHGLNPGYTFESFVVGGSNRLAHAAAMAVADAPAGAFNPLFFYGGVGLGKTHLLHAIGHRAMDQNADVEVLYVSSERFTNELIKSIMSQKTDEFRSRYRSIDILMIDDIQFIAGKESTQEEFFHTFNELYQSGKQIVISSDRHPKTIQTLDDRLRSRFEGGLIADVSLPDVETRTAIIRRKGEMLGVDVPHDVIEYIARRVQSNIRELEGALNKIIAMAQLFNQPIRMDIAAQALADTELESRRSEITPDRIIAEVSTHFDVTLAELRGRGRSKQIVLPRQIAMYLIRDETGSSLVEIGRYLDNRDHSTIMHGVSKIEDTLTTDTALRRHISDLREKLYGES